MQVASDLHSPTHRPNPPPHTHTKKYRALFRQVVVANTFKSSNKEKLVVLMWEEAVEDR